MKKTAILALISIILSGCGIQTKPYDYPNKSMKEYDSLDEKIEACKVEPELLDNMTTEALVETVYDYPLLGNMLLSSAGDMGYSAIRSYCDSLQELETRNDACTFLLKKIISLDKSSSDKMCLEIILSQPIFYDGLSRIDHIQLEKHQATCEHCLIERRGTN